ncbi:MAG: DEAD/DEAH box helicase [Bacilli bacterium]|nr:DEAD/DEAH box helicase [Bacilli bacterium]
MKKFDELIVNPLLIKGIEKMKFEHMTEVQEKVIPVALDLEDVIAQAPTGTGKTVAFALPILNKVDEEFEAVQTVVIAPTRELAVQITREINSVAFYIKNIRAVALYGGESIDRQITALKKRPQIVVATPGRLMDHMDRRTVRLDNVNTVVLDEADEMLNMGFKEDIDFILSAINTEHQTMLFSATISKEIERIAREFLTNPKTIRVTQNQLSVPLIEQKSIDIKEKDKVEVIARLIDINEYKLVMIFCNTKRMVDEVTSQLLVRGFMVEALHGDMKQMQRDRVMNRFRNGQINILVASDVAARGLDIDDVDAVINYDVPTDEEYYVHRIGRTGRAEKSGLSITLVTRQEKNRLRSIANYAKATITPMLVPSLDRVMEVRMKRIIAKALETSKEESSYQKYLTKNLNDLEVSGITKDELIKGLVLLQMKSTDGNTEIEEIKEEIQDRQKKRDQKVSRIFISIGRRDKIKVYDLTDWVVEHTGMTNADVNQIDIHDNFSFFEIPNQFVDELLLAADGASFNDRKLTVEVAKSKEDSSNRSRSRGGSSRDSYSHSSRKPKEKSYSSSRRESSGDYKPREKSSGNYESKSKSYSSSKRESSNDYRPREKSYSSSKKESLSDYKPREKSYREENFKKGSTRTYQKKK